MLSAIAIISAERQFLAAVACDGFAYIRDFAEVERLGADRDDRANYASAIECGAARLASVLASKSATAPTDTDYRRRAATAAKFLPMARRRALLADLHAAQERDDDAAIGRAFEALTAWNRDNRAILHG